jgi:signal transduction histidine kinase
MSASDDEVTRLREELRAATRARDVLLASVAHDLRNPLNTFAMSSGLLRDDIEREDIDPTRALALITRMDRAAQRMQQLIEDLLEASRIEAKRIELVMKPERAGHLVRDAAISAKALASEKGATVVLGAIDEEAVVAVDRGRIVQAISKLVTFALKAIGEGGVIHLGARREADDVEIALKAMPPGGAQGNASHDEGRGGLSLLIGRSLVEAHGGSVRLAASPDGPQILVRLPPAS